jgi:hypothetical protein
MSFRHLATASAIALVATIGPAAAGAIDSRTLTIQGMSLELTATSATTSVGVGALVGTRFGGKEGAEAALVEGVRADGELSGPGIDVPIRLSTLPGHPFRIPPLDREGEYLLSNVRLTNGERFLQPAIPSAATITVVDALQTKVSVRQLTPDELRARGISVDGRNFEVYEYTFSFIIEGVTVEIPYPVIIDTTTREVRPVARETPYSIPRGPDPEKPPRWNPPTVFTGVAKDIPEEGEIPEPAPLPLEGAAAPRKSIPFAIAIPSNFAVMHQFFAVMLTVSNGAASDIELHDVTATLKIPNDLRLSRSLPPVSFGQPVPIVDEKTGARFLVAQASGSAEWVLEGLRTGTHTGEIELRATMKASGQPESRLKGAAPFSVVVHDPRFNLTFSHPDTVRSGVEYSTFAFVTNMSPALQAIRLENLVPACSVAPGANVCRVDGTAAFEELTLASGDTGVVEYRLRSSVTGQVFATAGSLEGTVTKAAVQLHMGVSESGIPLSPATLVMPHYARYLDPELVSTSLGLLGIGYSAATAPLNATTAKFPRVIRTDVFRRAVDIARAGQRIYLGEAPADSLAHLALDLLGNGVALEEWDQLRRRELRGQASTDALAKEIEKAAFSGSAGFTQFASRFAEVTAHRGGYGFALVHGAATAASRPFHLTARGLTSGARLDIPEGSSSWRPELRYGTVMLLDGGSRRGELALVGRWTEDVKFSFTAAGGGEVVVDLVVPRTNPRGVARATLVSTAAAGESFHVELRTGAGTVELRNASDAVVASSALEPVAPAPLSIDGARQDLHLDSEGHRVSVLFNRPLDPAGASALKTKFEAKAVIARDGFTGERLRPIYGAALQEDERIVHLNFDHALSTNARYELRVDPLTDVLTGVAASFAPVDVVIENDRPAAILYGKVLRADGTPVPGAEVVLQAGAPQYDTAAADGSFLFEYVPRDPASNISGAYRMRAVDSAGRATSIQGAVRLPGHVHHVNLVYLGRGAAEGYVRYDNGEKVAGAQVVVGSTLLEQYRSATTDANGFYTIADLPVGPLTFSARDAKGNIAFAAGYISRPGQILVQDVSIYRKPYPGIATVRGVLRRSDTLAPLAAARVGVSTQGFGIVDGLTDEAGRFEFSVPSGFVTLLAADWSISRESAAVDFDLSPDEVRVVELILPITGSNEELVVVEGTVVREDRVDPGLKTPVAGAAVGIDKGPVTVTDEQGRFRFEAVPKSFAGRLVSTTDPVTRRIGRAPLPTPLVSGTNSVAIVIGGSDYGKGKFRVLLLDAGGKRVGNYRVTLPGIPRVDFESKGSGIYEYPGNVGQRLTFYAVPADREPGEGVPALGDQWAVGSASIEFDGQIASTTLRLPGQGRVRVALAGVASEISPVRLSYPAWDEVDQGIRQKHVDGSTNENGDAGWATFEKVPALQQFTAASAHPTYGSASSNGILRFDGDVASITLHVNRLATVSGVVYAIDGRTPVPGAWVELHDGRQDPRGIPTEHDGSFRFTNVAAGVSFRVIARITQDGIHRVGTTSGTTPALGGPAGNSSVILRRQGTVHLHAVYAGYKVYDPADPSKNVRDTTPGDLTDNAPVPLARFALRELAYPQRSFGTAQQPLIADIEGRRAISNLFEGAIRISASDPSTQELRGEWSGRIEYEGEEVHAWVPIGGGGVGAISVRVVDPNAEGAPAANAEVTLIRSTSVFDFATTDELGQVHFARLPLGTYRVDVYSKALARTGSAAGIAVDADATVPVLVPLTFVGAVDGTLTDGEAGGAAVPGAHVDLRAGTYQTRATTSVEGKFEFEGVHEGLVHLEARDPDSFRKANGQATVSATDTRRTVNLELEPTETLFVDVYLPNDSGHSSGVRVPLATLDVSQFCRYVDSGGRVCGWLRSDQGNSFRVRGLVGSAEYEFAVREIGGERRTVAHSGRFPKGSATDPWSVVLPAFGRVEVFVKQGASPAANARVSVSSHGSSRLAYTDSNGFAILSDVPLGMGKSLFVQAASADGRFSASATAQLESQSVPATVSLTLGEYASVEGYVEAEEGGPSAGSRVETITSAGSVHVLTDSEGRYRFGGIVPPTTISLVYLGPDGVSIGARQTVPVAAAGVVTAPPVKLDLTPPRVEGFYPEDGASMVSPDTAPSIFFSEPVHESTLSGIRLRLADGTPVAVVPTQTLNHDGTATVTLNLPPKPPGQEFPLRSHTLYSIFVPQTVTDRAGTPLPAPRGASFITADYAEPKVLEVSPAPERPLRPGSHIRFTFNEPIDPAPWQPGGGGSFVVYEIDAAGAAGNVAGVIGGQVAVDPDSAATLFFIPAEPWKTERFYRVVFAARDLQGNASEFLTYHFFSYDETKPAVAITAPPEGAELVSGSEYTANVSIVNLGTGTPAIDVEKVEWFQLLPDGSDVFIIAVRSTPFSWRFVAPDAPQEGMPFALRAVATDLSGNVSEPASRTWIVRPNSPPRNVAVALDRIEGVFPGNSVGTTVTFEDEGTVATVQITAAALRTDGTTWSSDRTLQISRPSIGDPWPAAHATFDLPATLAVPGSVTFTARVTDVRGLTATVNATIDLALDSTAPSILSLSPPAGTRLAHATQFQVEAIVRDDGTGVAEVVFVVDGTEIRTPAGSPRTQPGGEPGSVKFSSGTIVVPAKNVDTRVPVSVTAIDFAANESTESFELVYVGVNDPSLPTAAWMCPADRAALPANEPGFPLTLRIRANDDIEVVSVAFLIPGVDGTPAATKVAGTDVWEATVTIDTPPAGSGLTITAIVNDADAEHEVRLPVRIDFVAPDVVVTLAREIRESDLAAFENRTVLVRGGAARLVPHVPVTFGNLLVIGGGSVESLESDMAQERRLDIGVTGTLYVDCVSKIDVSNRGYLGGWAIDRDGRRNDDVRGQTVGRTVDGGASGGASASHAGLGGETVASTTNSHYGSITAPSHLGSGGSGSGTNTRGGTGGGAVAIGGSGGNARLVIAGAVRADGESGIGRAGAGSGGSIRIAAAEVIVGDGAGISASGGDDDAANNASRGGGGGRIAIDAESRLDIRAALAEARGGRNAGGESVTYLDGGAGTVWIRRPGQQLGELHVSSFDSRHPASVHLTRPTPLDGDLAFDAMTAGPRALVRADVPLVVRGRINERESLMVSETAAVVLEHDYPILSVQTLPVAGSTLLQATSLRVDYVASSIAGVGSVKTHFTPVQDRNDLHVDYPTTKAAWFPRDVPATALPGEATLSLVVRDRAGRSAAVDPLEFIIARNEAPIIDNVAVDPPGGVFPGGTVRVRVSATDDVAVRRIVLRWRIGDGPVSTDTRSYNVPSIEAAFQFGVSTAATSGDVIRIEATAEDDFPGRVYEPVVRIIEVLPDTIPPTIHTVLAPSEGFQVAEGMGQTVWVRVAVTDAQTGVASVEARLNGDAPIALSQSGTLGSWPTYHGYIPVPDVPGPDPYPATISFTATDKVGNVSPPSSVSGVVVPIVDDRPPTVVWNYPSDGALFPPGYEAVLSLDAFGRNVGYVSNGIASVEYIPEAGTVTKLHSAEYANYQGKWTLPHVLEETISRVRVIVTNWAGVSVEREVAVRIRPGASILSDTWLAEPETFEGTVYVRGATITLTAPQQFETLVLLKGAKITHPEATAGVTPQRVSIDVEEMYIEAGAAIDADGKGFAEVKNGVGLTWPGTFTGGSSRQAGGSHGGVGGNSLRAAKSYGSWYEPATPGSSGVDWDSQTCSPCQGGGGIVRVVGHTVTIDGTITASGGSDGSGGGGSIWITCDVCRGGGGITANGGQNGYYTGGGGRIAIQSGTFSLDPEKVSAGSPSNNGGAGTVLLRTAEELYGRLLVRQPTSGYSSGAATQLPGLGTGTATVVTEDSVSDMTRPSNFPNDVKGAFLSVNRDGDTERWRVTGNDSRTLYLDTHNNPLSVEPGAQYAGELLLDSLELRATKFHTLDAIHIVSLPVIGSDNSAIIGINNGPPRFWTSSIRVVNRDARTYMEGDPWAVSESDWPVVLTVTNQRTGETWTTIVEEIADGMFSIAIEGESGDVLLLRGVDSGRIPMQSYDLEIGAVP